MKKYCLLMMFFLLALALQNTLPAQEITEKGILIGLNNARFTRYPSDYFDPQFGAVKNEFGGEAGFYFAFGLNDRMTLGPEILFSRVRAGYTDDREEVTFTFNYLRMPVLLSYAAGGALKLSAGGYFAVSLSDTKRSIGRDPAQPYDVTGSLGDTHVQLGLVLGASYNIHRMTLHAQYLRGNYLPTRTYAAPDTPLPGLSEWHLMLGYSL